MNANAKNILEQALKLTPEQKHELIGVIWDSLEAELVPQLSAAQMAELERRVALHKADPSRAIPWEQAHREIRERLATLRTERERRADAS
ncbi:MAG: addiction module protein [Planctomycetes bacterium]|nr:addiction module protein [Planctomycetota bacterium]MCA8944784.1 addiction module protein [Planctomycetota bacterium]